MASEKENMLGGLPHFPSDPALSEERQRTRRFLRNFNATEYKEPVVYREALAQLLPNCQSDIFVVPPFYCDYGYNIYAGHNVYFNYNCVALDSGIITIVNNTMFGLGVHIYAVTHPTDAMERRKDVEICKKVSIGDDCWIGGHAVILPGVSIGHRCIVGAGAVVTGDVSDDTTVVGNPAKPQK